VSGPYMDHVAIAHIIIAVFSGVSSLLSVYLTYKLRVAQKERRRFYTQMRVKHGLAPSTAQDIADRETLRKTP
jgi:hypothetical protein